MKTVLLIEDNINILENLTECLELEGYNTLVANNGKNGVALAEKFIPDLIICDVLMQSMNGYEVLQSILKNDSTHHIPFIFSTSNAEKKDIEKALLLGADDYIIKPYQLKTLLKFIEKWLNCGSIRKNEFTKESDL